MGLTPAIAEKRSVSSDSIDVPADHPCSERRPEISWMGCYFNRLCRGANRHKFTVHIQAVDQCRHGLAAGSGRNNRSCSAHFLQLFRHILRRGIDVSVCPKLRGKVSRASSASNGYCAIAELICKLHREMAESADRLNRDQVSGRRAGMTQSIEGSDTSAQERGSIFSSKPVGNRGQRLRRGDHVLRVTAVEREARDRTDAAQHEISATAGRAHPAVAAIPAHSDTLTLFPCRDRRTHFIDYTCDFMTWHAWVLQPWPIPFFHHLVTVAHAAGFDLHSHPVRLGLWNFPLDELQVAASF